MPLRTRLAVGVVTGTLLVLSFSFLALHWIIRDALYRHMDEEMAAQMWAVAAYAAEHPGREGVTEYMPQFRTRAHQDFFQIWDADGNILARSDSSAGRDLRRLPSSDASATYRDLDLPDGHRGRAVSQTFSLQDRDPRRFLTVVVAEETERLNELEARIHVVLLVVALVTAVAMLLIARQAVLRGLRPLDDFARSVERVDPEDPQARLHTGPLPAELQTVAASFSTLLQRLLAALAREKRYARNVAHELRNPLAEIRLLADVGSGGGDPKVCLTSIREIGVVAAGMERAVDALMALTRYEAGLESPQPEPMCLDAELRRQTDLLAGEARQREIAMALDIASDVWVHVDSAMVQRMIANLLGNAVSHAPRGATVHVALRSDGDLDIANPAPHLDCADLPRLGERFYRVGRDGSGQHAGLGLSLAFAVAKILGLKLALELRDDGVLLASVRGFSCLHQPGTLTDGPLPAE
jgi:two-component system sensor histidine kinase QseC